MSRVLMAYFILNVYNSRSFDDNRNGKSTHVVHTHTHKSVELYSKSNFWWAPFLSEKFPHKLQSTVTIVEIVFVKLLHFFGTKKRMKKAFLQNPLKLCDTFKDCHLIPICHFSLEIALHQRENKYQNRVLCKRCRLTRLIMASRFSLTTPTDGYAVVCDQAKLTERHEANKRNSQLQRHD